MTPLGWLGCKTSTQTNKWKPCRVSCLQLDTSLATARQQRLHLLCLCLGRSQTGNRRLTLTVWWGRLQSSPGLSWPVLSAWDCCSCPFQFIPLTLVEANNETLLPVRWYLAIANDCSCEVTDYGDAHFTGCSYHLYHYTWWAWLCPPLFLKFLPSVLSVTPSLHGIQVIKQIHVIVIFDRLW